MGAGGQCWERGHLTVFTPLSVCIGGVMSPRGVTFSVVWYDGFHGAGQYPR